MLSCIGAADDWDSTAGVGSHNNESVVVTVAVHWAHKIEAFELQQDLARLWGTDESIYFISSDPINHILESTCWFVHVYAFLTNISQIKCMIIM